MILNFLKYQGLGNDFILLEGQELMTPERAVALCDRHRGVGADGVLTIQRPRLGGDAYLHIYNSDGSVAAMCGNGVRCVARYLAERRGLTGELAIETDAGVKKCVVHRGARGAVEAVSVEMGPGRWLAQEAFEVGGEALQAERVSMGNPHAVVFGPASRERAARLGPLVSGAVPGGLNVGFAEVKGAAIDLVVWERGAGLTQACGTGACAAALAAVKCALVPPGPVEVRLPGGALQVTVARNLTGVLMRGPAERVFEGRVEVEG